MFVIHKHLFVFCVCIAHWSGFKQEFFGVDPGRGVLVV
jgi:hypothetical protein